MQPRQRRRAGALTQLGAIGPSTMLAFGLALVFVLAGIGLLLFSFDQREIAGQPPPTSDASPTAFVAIVETPFPTPTSARAATPTPTILPVAGRATPRAATPAAPLGTGQARAVRSLAGSLVLAIGGQTLPPPAAPPTPSPVVVAQVPPTATSTPTLAPVAVLPPYNPPPAYVPPAPPPPVQLPPAPVPAPVAPAPTAAPAPAPVPTATPTPLPPPTSTAIVVPPTATTPPLPPLPAAVLPRPNALPYSYDFAYQAAPNVDLAAQPKSANAYQTTWRAYSAADVTALAQALGLRGGVQQIPEGYRVTDPGTLTVTVNGGVIRYSAPAAVAPGAPGATTTPVVPLTDDQARAAARSWLDSRKLLPPNADQGRVSHPTATQTVVTFHPLEPLGPNTGDPSITVAFDSSNTVRELRYRWPQTIAPRPSYPLRPATAAWADVQAGKGYTEVDWTPPLHLPNPPVFSGPATVTKVELAWTAATGADGTTYQVPLYVFSGTVAIAGQPQPVPFRAYIPAAATP